MVCFPYFQVWGNMKIDGHDVTCEYQEPPETQDAEPSLQFDHKFIADHVRQSQYALQIVR
jgi:hypothetical protein